MDANFANDTGLSGETCRQTQSAPADMAVLRSYVDDRQCEAVLLDAMLEGIEALLLEGRNSNAVMGMVTISRRLIDDLVSKLDLTELPKGGAA